QVIIPKLNGSLVVQGYTSDTTSYAANEDIPPTIYQHRNELTTTLRLGTDNVKVYNLNVANMAGKIERGGQALAVSVVTTNSGVYACAIIWVIMLKLLFYQDTLYANKGANLYAKSYISGAIDFIFGQVANAWFESCDIVALDEGHFTANGRNSDTNPSTFVFNNARVSGLAAPGTVYLGRPWQPYARVIFQNSELSEVINPAGWELWEDNNTANVYFRECNNSGVGAATEKRVDFSGMLAKPVTIAEVLGEKFKSEWWVDT
ncbi:hypothetical protein PHYSODRAFT_262481, partial [Phytophthora sojae]